MSDFIRLTDREKRVLVLITNRADATNKEIAGLAGMREHSVRYVRESLLNSGLLDYAYIIDTHRLGYIDIGVYLSRGVASSRERRDFEKLIQGNPKISWLAKTGGDFQYGMTMYAKRLYELDDLFSSIRPSLKGAYFEKNVGIRLDWTIYSPNYLCPEVKDPFEIKMTSREEIVPIDPDEHELLTMLAKNPKSYLAGLARESRTSPASLHYRMEKLRKKKILRRQVYVRHLDKLGHSLYRILITERAMSVSQKDQFRKYCADNPNVTAFFSCTGAWDYEIRFESAEAEQVDRFCQDLFDCFGTGIGSVRTIQQFRVLKRYTYPSK